jgi:hypothetical protein
VSEENETLCPKDLADWAYSDKEVLSFLYDINLLPEQITDTVDALILRGFQVGWTQAMSLKNKEIK